MLFVGSRRRDGLAQLMVPMEYGGRVVRASAMCSNRIELLTGAIATRHNPPVKVSSCVTVISFGAMPRAECSVSLRRYEAMRATLAAWHGGHEACEWPDVGRTHGLARRDTLRGVQHVGGASSVGDDQHPAPMNRQRKFCEL
jgi:hypothetical protein